MSAQLSRNHGVATFSVAPAFESLHGMLIDVHAYLFSRDGFLIDRQPIRKGRARFALVEDECRDARMVLAPPVEGSAGRRLDLDAIRHYQVHETDWSYVSGRRHYTLSPVPETVWRWWLVHALWRRLKPPRERGGFIIF